MIFLSLAFANSELNPGKEHIIMLENGKKFLFFYFTGILLTVLFFAGIAMAETKLTFATAYSPKSNLDIAANDFVDIIAKKTNGRIKIIHYGSASLYNFKDMIPAITKNQVNMGILHVAMVGRRSAALEFISSFAAQGCWTSIDHYYRFIDSPEIRKITDSEISKYFNAKLLGVLTLGGTAWGRTDKPIKSIDDLKGIKFRTSGKAMATLWKALGAIPVEISSKEIYTALQRGTLQGFATSVARVRRAKIYEVAPYITVDPTQPFMSNYLAINRDAWAKIAQEDQKIIMEEALKMEKITREKAAQEHIEELKILEEKAKVLYNFSPSEVTRFVEAARPVMKDLAQKRLGDKFEILWSLLEKTQ